MKFLLIYTFVTLVGLGILGCGKNVEGLKISDATTQTSTVATNSFDEIEISGNTDGSAGVCYTYVFNLKKLGAPYSLEANETFSVKVYDHGTSNVNTNQDFFDTSNCLVTNLGNPLSVDLTTGDSSHQLYLKMFGNDMDQFDIVIENDEGDVVSTPFVYTVHG